MIEQDFKTMLLRELPAALESDVQVRESIWRLISPYFAPKQETESRFDRVLGELRQMREESERKWEEQKRKWDENQAELRQMHEESERKWEEQKRKWDENQAELRQMREESERKWEEQKRKWDENQAELRQMREESERKWAEYREELRQMREESERKWEEQNRKWDENQATINQVLAELKRLDTKITTKIGAIGARWGKSSEDSFRNALRGILGKTFGVQVINVNELDDTGVVFGRPEFVELDLIIHNGMLLICEIKSSISKADVYAFERKARFYEQRHQRQATQLIIISPMIDVRAQLVIQQLGIHAYDDAEAVGLDEGRT